MSYETQQTLNTPESDCKHVVSRSTNPEISSPTDSWFSAAEAEFSQLFPPLFFLLRKGIFKVSKQWRIQDFPEGGAWTLQGGREHAKFSRDI